MKDREINSLSFPPSISPPPALTILDYRTPGGQFRHDQRTPQARPSTRRIIRAQGPDRLRRRLRDGRLRSPDPRLHASRHLGGPAPHPAAGRLAGHLDADRRRRRRHPVRHAQRLLRPRPGADLDDPAVRGVHRPVRVRAGLLGPAGLPHHRRARPRRRVRHRHGAGRRKPGRPSSGRGPAPMSRSAGRPACCARRW